MASRKKLLTSAVALGTAAALVLGGTFAWQSINQTALNQSSDDVNPGGRLHDDFDGENKDVYVENFAEEPIFARIRLEEYLEVVVNNGGTAETVEMVIGTERTEDADGWVDRTGKIFDFTGRVSEDGKTVDAGYDDKVTDKDGNPTYWWTWTMGSESSADAYYMPTFNLNKDSLEADINGYYTQRGMITDKDLGNQYAEMKTYTAGTTEKGIEIFDADDDTEDEVGYYTEDSEWLDELAGDGHIQINKDVTHTAAQIGDTKGLISMETWLAKLEAGEATDDYWVYDTDGWVYWSSPIQPHTTTGRLLDGIKLNHVMDDSWYYSINVVAQFVTADDVGNEENGRGFYDTTKGTAPTDNAWMLLNHITSTDDVLPPITDLPDKRLHLTVAATEYVELSKGEPVQPWTDDVTNPSSITLTANGKTLDPATDYTYSGGVLTLLTEEQMEITVSYAEIYKGTIYANDAPHTESTAQTYDLTLMSWTQIKDDGLGEALSVTAKVGDIVNLTLAGDKTADLLTGRSASTLDQSAINRFRINNNEYSDAWTRTTDSTNDDDEEIFTIENCGALTLNYTDKTIKFVPVEGFTGASIVVTLDETPYSGTIQIDALPPTASGGLST